jgi:glutamyl-tRNA reductase
MILLCGVNHRTAPLELRERLAMDSARVTWSLERAKSTALWQEVVVLSTCNRTEVYVVTPDDTAVVRPSHKGSHPGAASLEQISDDRASVTGCAGHEYQTTDSSSTSRSGKTSMHCAISSMGVPTLAS